MTDAEPINIEKLSSSSKVCPNGCDPNDTMWYNSTWDRFFCRPCNIWLETGCSVKPEENLREDGFLECYFQCWNCPPTPTEAFAYE